jgi:hypothetical protein
MCTLDSHSNCALSVLPIAKQQVKTTRYMDFEYIPSLDLVLENGIV